MTAPTRKKKATEAWLEVAVRRLEEIVPYARNPRKNEPAVAKVMASLKEFGWRQPIVVDPEMVIVAGHTRYEAAKRLGWTTAPVHVAEGLTPAQIKAYRLGDNRTGQEAEWDNELLALELEELQGFDFDLSATGFGDDEIAALFGGGYGTEGLTDEDAVPPVPKSATTVLGDLWVLGRHRLLCGDSTSVDAVERLMNGERAVLFATDPPYLVNYDGTNHPSKGAFDNKKRNKDWSDSYHEQGWDDEKQGQQFYLDFYKIAIATAITENAAWYCWHASRRQAMLEDVWIQCGAFAHQQIIWVKSRPVLTHSVYMWSHEPCLMGWVKTKKPKVNRTGLEQFPRTVWDMDRLEQFPLTVWEIKNKEIDCKDHPTSKPVRVFSMPMELHTDPGDLCYEPFSGSGSQLIAADKTGRRCYGLEMSPIYCDVIVRRWEEFTGQKAILDGDGRTFAGVAAGRTK